MLSLPAPTKIDNPALCEAIIGFIQKYPRRVPTQRLYAGTYLRRTVSRERLTAPQQGNVLYSRPGGDSNRLDGKTPRGNTRPALYLSLDDHATLAENLHYSAHALQVPVIQYQQLEERAHLWLPEKTVITLRVLRMLTVADFRRDDMTGMGFLREMNANLEIREALRKAGYGHILLGMYHPDDYSVARGVGFAVDQVLGLAGVLFNTARISQHGERFADNLALFGDYQKPLTSVQVVATQEFHREPITGKLVSAFRYLDPSLNAANFPSFLSNAT